jgi:hypothetical protein
MMVAAPRLSINKTIRETHPGKSQIPPRGIFSRRKLVIFPLVLQLSQLKVYQGKGDELILNDVEMFPLQAARIIQASKKLGIKL